MQRSANELNFAETGFVLRGADDAACYSRMSAPARGIVEDAATGGASGPLDRYLVRHGVLSSKTRHRLLNSQGVRMGCASRIHTGITCMNGATMAMQVGGTLRI